MRSRLGPTLTRSGAVALNSLLKGDASLVIEKVHVHTKLQAVISAARRGLIEL
jgi:hypothetical protein